LFQIIIFFFYLFRLRLENERLKTDNASIRSDLVQTKQLKDEIILKNTELIAQLQNELEIKNKEIKKLEEQLRGDASTQGASTTRVKQLEEELNTERQQRQRLVIEMHRLEQKCENLQSELQNGNIHKVKSAPSDSNMTWDSKFMDTLDLDDLPVNITILLSDVRYQHILHERNMNSLGESDNTCPFLRLLKTL
jgi:DNA repair exonuclease SbcCD ATPase subunit